MSYVKIGVGGPVGSGKTALIERLTREMSKEYSICVVTNDIYTKEDAEFLTKNSCLPADRIVGVETGGPGVTRSDLLVINKTDLAPLVGASLEVMASDSKRMRGDRPFLFTNLMSREGVSQVIDWIKKSVLFEDLK